MTLLTIIGALIVTAAAFVAWSFVLDYRHDPWRDSEYGRWIMYSTRGLAVILTYVAVALWFDPPQLARELSRVVIFGYILWMLVAQWRLLRLGRRNKLRPLRGVK